MKGARVVLPDLQLVAGIVILTGFLLTVSRFMLGYNVLNDWHFLLASAIVSLLPATALLVFIFRTASYRGCSWSKKWPYVTLTVIIQVYLGSFMFCNAAGYYLNRWLPSGEIYTADVLITARSEAGFKRYLPTVTIFGNDELGEKKVNRETWNSLQEGAIVPVIFQEGLFGYTNIMKFHD
jgi:hypothetical protein